MAKAKDVQIKLDLETREAQRNLKKLAQETKELDGDLEDTKSAGEAMADAIAASAEEMSNEIDATKRAVDALDKAMEDADLDLDIDSTNAVADLKKLGLTAEDIEGDAEQLAQALKRIDEVNVKAVNSGFDSLDQAVGRTSDGVGKADDVTRSFVGNSISELPGVGEAFGPAGEAISQMTEGLMAGEIGMKDLVKAGGGMAAVGGAVMLATKAWESYQARQEALAKKQAEILEGAQEALDVAKDGKELLEQVQDLPPLAELIIGRMDADQLGNVGESLGKLGLNWNDLSRFQKGSVDQQGAMIEVLMSRHSDLTASQAAMVAKTITSTEKYEVAMARIGRATTTSAITADIGETVKALEELDDASDELDLEEEIAKALAMVTVEGGKSAKILDEIRKAHPDASETEVYARLVKRLEEVTKETDRLANANARARDEGMRLAEEYEDQVIPAIAGVHDDLQDMENIDGPEIMRKEALRQFDLLTSGMQGNVDRLTIERDIEEQMEGVVEAWKNADNDIAANGFDGATDSIRDAKILQGELTLEVMKYMEEVLKLPPEVITEISQDLDKQSVAVIDEWYALLAKGVTMPVRIVALGSNGINTGFVDANGRTINMPVPLATGGPMQAGGSYLVGEEGPELITPSRSGYVHNADETNDMLAAPRSASGVTNVHINMPAGSKPTDVMHAFRRYERIQGQPV